MTPPANGRDHKNKREVSIRPFCVHNIEITMHVSTIVEQHTEHIHTSTGDVRMRRIRHSLTREMTHILHSAHVEQSAIPSAGRKCLKNNVIQGYEILEQRPAAMSARSQRPQPLHGRYAETMYTFKKDSVAETTAAEDEQEANAAREF